MTDEQSFVLQTIDGIDDIVVGFYLEAFGRFGAIDLLECVDLNGGVDGKQTLLERFHLDLPHGFGGGHQLAVDVGDAHPVRIDDGEMSDSGAYQAFGTPASYTSYTEDDDADITDPFECGISDQKFRAFENSCFYSHNKLIFWAKIQFFFLIFMELCIFVAIMHYKPFSL